MGRLAGFRYREVVRKLKACGFEFDRQAAGSHEIWFNAGTNRYTTIPNHPGDLPEGTLRAILRQAGIEPDTFLRIQDQRSISRIKRPTRLAKSHVSRPLQDTNARTFPFTMHQMTFSVTPFPNS